MTPDERNEQAVGAPRAVTVRGRTFLIAKTRPADFLTVRNWVLKRVRPKSPLAEVVKDLAGLSPDLQRIVVEKAAEKQLANGQPGQVDFNEALDALTSADGCRFLFWLHARPNHPDLRQEELVTLIDEDNAAEVFFELDEATGMLALAGEAGGRPGRPGGPPGNRSGRPP
jgi:hypothetical protein